MNDGYSIVRRCLESAQDELRHACHAWSELLPECEIVNKAFTALQLLGDIERDIETANPEQTAVPRPHMASRPNGVAAAHD